VEEEASGQALGIRSYDADADGPALTLGVFQPGLLGLCFRLEGLRQWRELTLDVLEEQPLLRDFWHLNVIARGFSVPCHHNNYVTIKSARVGKNKKSSDQ
jgi:hypothetical protein